ncbi:MAG TPA: hypothetical protein VLI41_05100 [Phenylobacterium sp.]|nr:hypothetical protein [Phenylobacterium sp.]
MRPIVVTALIALACAGPAQAQLLRIPLGPRTGAGGPPVASAPPGLPPAEAEIWPYPAPDPKSWWDEPGLKRPEAADPLGGRRIPHGATLAPINNGIDPSTYRLWGLMPLQWEVLYPGEMIVEVWVRPSTSVRQSVVRVIVRRDGKAFVQVRAGLACCEADIARRIGFDAELPPGSAERFLALRNNPAWSSPRLVRTAEHNAAQGVCVNGVSYDLTLVVRGQSRALHRACDDAAIGQVADILEPVLRAGLGHEPRFDVLFRGKIDYSAERSAYQELIASGGSLKADLQGRAQPPGAEIAPKPE